MWSQMLLLPPRQKSKPSKLPTNITTHSVSFISWVKKWASLTWLMFNPLSTSRSCHYMVLKCKTYLLIHQDIIVLYGAIHAMSNSCPIYFCSVCINATVIFFMLKWHRVWNKNIPYCYEMANPCPHVYIVLYGAMHGSDWSCAKCYNTCYILSSSALWHQFAF